MSQTSEDKWIPSCAGCQWASPAKKAEKGIRGGWLHSKRLPRNDKAGKDTYRRIEILDARAFCLRGSSSRWILSADVGLPCLPYPKPAFWTSIWGSTSTPAITLENYRKECQITRFHPEIGPHQVLWFMGPKACMFLLRAPSVAIHGVPKFNTYPKN